MSAPPASVVLFRALHLGDLLCAVPAWRAMRAAWPQAHVALCGLPWAREFVPHVAEFIDEFIEFPGWPGLPEQTCDVSALPPFLAEMQARRFDLAVQMHGAGSVSTPLVQLFGARRTAGYVPADAASPDPASFLAYPAERPEIWRHLALAAHLGAAPQGDHLQFDVRAEDDAALERAADREGLDPAQSFVVLHPGAKAAWRRWEPAHFAAVGDAMADDGHQIVLTGVASERPLAAEIARRMRRPCVNLAGRLSWLGALAALVQRSALMVCGDTGLSHLACALGCPSVVIFLRSEAEGWPPLNRVRHRVVSRPSGVAPDDVLREARDLLGALVAA